MNNCLIFSGTANPDLSEKIAASLGKKLGKINIYRFLDKEISLQIEENIRGKDIFIIQPTCPPVNENLMEFYTMDAFRELLLRGYAVCLIRICRQERKDRAGVPIPTKLVANLLCFSRSGQNIKLGLHSPQYKVL